MKIYHPLTALVFRAQLHLATGGGQEHRRRACYQARLRRAAPCAARFVSQDEELICAICARVHWKKYQSPRRRILYRADIYVSGSRRNEMKGGVHDLSKQFVIWQFILIRGFTVFIH